jgi:hypothetical protein
MIEEMYNTETIILGNNLPQVFGRYMYSTASRKSRRELEVDDGDEETAVAIDANRLVAQIRGQLSFIDLMKWNAELFSLVARDPMFGEATSLWRGFTSAELTTAVNVDRLEDELEVYDLLERLSDGCLDRKTLRQLAHDLAIECEEHGELAQSIVAMGMSQLPTASLVALIDAISDRELGLLSPSLRRAVLNLLSAGDSNLAQAAASCLVFCVEGGRESVLERLDTEPIPTHRQLVRDLLDLV